MDLDVLHSWAKDAAALAAQEKTLTQADDHLDRLIADVRNARAAIEHLKAALDKRWTPVNEQASKKGTD